MIYEEPGGSRPSGDGVVPLDSMEYCREWAPEVDVRVEQLDNCDHRGVLKDPRFHEILRSLLLAPGGPSRPPDASGIADLRWQAAKDDPDPDAGGCCVGCTVF